MKIPTQKLFLLLLMLRLVAQKYNLVTADSMAIARQHNCHSLGGDSFLQSACSKLFRQLLLQKKSTVGSVVLLAVFQLQAQVSPVNFLNFENTKGYLIKWEHCNLTGTNSF